MASCIIIIVIIILLLLLLLLKADLIHVPKWDEWALIGLINENDTSKSHTPFHTCQHLKIEKR